MMFIIKYNLVHDESSERVKNQTRIFQRQVFQTVFKRLKYVTDEIIGDMVKVNSYYVNPDSIAQLDKSLTSM